MEKTLKPLSVLILSPELSQAKALAYWLRNACSSCYISGGILTDGQPKIQTPFPFDTIVHVRNNSDISSFDSAIPTGSACTLWMVQKYGDFTAGSIKFDAANLRVFDKIWLYGIARDIGVSTPETYLKFRDIPSDQGPVFYKPRFEGTDGPRRIASQKEKIPTIFRSKDFVFQEYIPGREVFGFGFISQNGKVLVESQHLEIVSFPPAGGSAVAVKSLNSPRLSELSRKLLADINYSGWGLVEFKYCRKRRDFVLMEINAKWWASLEFALRVEPAFGKKLFGIDGKREFLPGLFWLDRFLCSLNGNFISGLRAASLPKCQYNHKLPQLKSIISGALPLKLKDYLNKVRRQ